VTHHINFGLMHNACTSICYVDDQSIHEIWCA